jgi:hypothetical protein
MFTELSLLANKILVMVTIEQWYESKANATTTNRITLTSNHLVERHRWHQKNSQCMERPKCNTSWKSIGATEYRELKYYCVRRGSQSFSRQTRNDQASIVIS